jgi:hypothetical protein
VEHARRQSGHEHNSYDNAHRHVSKLDVHNGTSFYTSRSGNPYGVGNTGLFNPDKESMDKRGNIGGRETRTTPVSAIARSHRTLFQRGSLESTYIQARIVVWDDIKHNPPRELKISPIVVIPHKLKAFCSILDLSFQLKLKKGGVLASVNDTMEKTTPKGAIDQIGEWLSRIIRAFTEADEMAKVLLAKWDIKDGFWRLDCAEGEEYNFANVLPQPEGEPIRIVIPILLQMGWVESTPYFYAATETARDIAEEYIKMTVNSLCDHKFVKYTIGDKEYETLPTTATHNTSFLYMVKVYIGDFMSLVIPVSQDQLRHVATAVMMGIHDVSPRMPTTVTIQSPKRN